MIKNILVIPPFLKGGLVARQSTYNDNTWAVDFDRIGNILFGVFRLPSKTFEPGSQVRLWNIVYLDETLRVMRAKRLDEDENENEKGVGKKESFVFILQRCREDERIDVDI